MPCFILTDVFLVLSFVGATGSTTISFILPGLFYWKVRVFMFLRLWKLFAECILSAVDA